MRLRRLCSPLVLALGLAARPAVPATAIPGVAQAGGPGAFVAVHGRRSLLMGYPQSGLEAWAYPLQLLSGYQVRFREAGHVTPFEGAALLSRVETSPSEVVRVYIGPDFVVRERLFTPLDAPGAVITYEVEGAVDVQVEVRFQPSLDLMWPAALGGQTVAWDEARSGFVEREPLHGFNATIRSPESVAHDDTGNSATGRPDAPAMVLAPRKEADGGRRARVFIAADPPEAAPGGAAAVPLAKRLEGDEGRLRAQAQAHAAAVLDEAVQVVTPDAEVNRALAAAITALDQAWVCAPTLGCGEVAGYGPSRPGRRPQYAWFFAGDGLVAVDGLLAAGLYPRAREELAFIARYRDARTGMIWHEMSLSAPLIDWGRYPYMFAHVDITLQYLATLARYVDATGDRAFLAAQWPGVEAAWRYSRALADPATGLPTIPAGKQGPNEQAALRDDVRLSSAWIDAADGFASLARTAGRRGLAAQAERAAQVARASVRSTGWDAAQGFWLSGHAADGAPVHERRSDAMRVLLQGAFTPTQVDAALDRLSAPAFLADWGERTLPSDAPGYDPNAYSQGSVWALGTSAAATTFWKAHRPLAAWTAWRGLLAWSALDSPGHLHEVAAGDLFHPERESVPEQTWSSAGFLTAFMGGLLGLDPHGDGRTLGFSPHLPAEWGEVDVRRVRVGGSHLDLHLSEDAQSLTLEVVNDGAPVTLDFAPEIPLGARLVSTRVDGAPRPAQVEFHAQEQQVRLDVVAEHGVTRAVLRYQGGVRIAPVQTPPRPGDASVAVKVGPVTWTAGALEILAYVADPEHADIDLLTPMKPTKVNGAELFPLSPGRYRLRLPAVTAPGQISRKYAPVDVMVSLATAGG